MAESAARIGKHPIHPMLVVFPIGLWVTALVFDIVEMATGNPLWRTLAFWNIVGGIVGALLAAVPGFLDYPGTKGREGRIATWHMILNLAAVVLFAVNAFLRLRVSADSPWPLLLSQLSWLRFRIQAKGQITNHCPGSSNMPSLVS